jgi:DNA-directed RNA polymerase specialized sigma subunit
MLNDLEMTVYQHEISKIVLDAIIKRGKTDSARQRRIDVFVCRVYHDMTFKQIGEELGMHQSYAQFIYVTTSAAIAKFIKKQYLDVIFN